MSRKQVITMQWQGKTVKALKKAAKKQKKAAQVLAEELVLDGLTQNEEK